MPRKSTVIVLGCHYSDVFVKETSGSSDVHTRVNWAICQHVAHVQWPYFADRWRHLCYYTCTYSLQARRRLSPAHESNPATHPNYGLPVPIMPSGHGWACWLVWDHVDDHDDEEGEKERKRGRCTQRAVFVWCYERMLSCVHICSQLSACCVILLFSDFLIYTF